jgi:hypothetical protein
MDNKLENIKIILNIKDCEYDEIILLYIKKVKNMVLDYCNLKELNCALEGFVEDKVVSIIKQKINIDGKEHIKAITRGDTRIEYSTDTFVNATDFSTDDMKFLNKFRKLRFY